MPPFLIAWVKVLRCTDVARVVYSRLVTAPLARVNNSRHTSLLPPQRLSSFSDYRKIHHDLILHLYRTAGRRIRLDAVVSLFERIFAGGAELLRRDGRRDRDSD